MRRAGAPAIRGLLAHLCKLASHGSERLPVAVAPDSGRCQRRKAGGWPSVDTAASRPENPDIENAGGRAVDHAQPDPLIWSHNANQLRAGVESGRSGSSACGSPMDSHSASPTSLVTQQRSPDVALRRHTRTAGGEVARRARGKCDPRTLVWVYCDNLSYRNSHVIRLNWRL